MEKTREEKNSTLVLYNYPSFSGAFSALFAHRVILDFLGSLGFTSAISRQSKCKVIGFDHRKSTLKMVSSIEDLPEKVKVFVDVERSNCSVMYEHFTSKLVNLKSGSVSYIWSLPDITTFNVGLNEKRTMVNCFTNMHFYGELLAMNAIDLISKGKSYISYGEDVGVKADGHSYLSGEIAVVYWQRNNLKMCLRTIYSATDTFEAYGGGGSSSSNSFIIKMDEYNQWLSI
ncbi:hypothetical protein K2173_006151 [Erythroxylum novogranatense]|uniref:Uncharacterized protein n=1 Tax=Erythroxylum novogranatense TaxID=1862640 RepID=A0AAV8TC96_9ROSI|nr:hypothetical protein K2173_006151 [Erythroxylum novogranatense]